MHLIQTIFKLCNYQVFRLDIRRLQKIKNKNSKYLTFRIEAKQSRICRSKINKFTTKY